MTQVRKYANLPDLDNAPDIYETPDLTDDASTLQTTASARSPSPAASESSEPASGISRRRLHPDQARSHFLPSRVDAREADFSDRLSAKRQSYRVKSRRRRRDGAVIENEEEDDGDYSDEDEEEGLERRMARLRREVEEVKAEVARRKAETQGQGEKDKGNISQEEHASDGGIEELSKALNAVRASQRDAISAHARLAKQLSNPDTTPNLESEQTSDTATRDELQARGTPIPAAAGGDVQTLSKVADFESRITALERSLGLSALDTNTSTSPLPILPTLSLLDSQVALLTSSSSFPHLEEAFQKSLDTQTSKMTGQSLAGTTATTAAADADAKDKTTLTPEDVAKLHALYALLPTLSSLAPTLPPLLERLRSLRVLHQHAAAAAQTLDEVERRQAETEAEIKAWREGLAKVEGAVRGAERGMRENAGVVEGWVRELEDRVRRMG